MSNPSTWSERPRAYGKSAPEIEQRGYQDQRGFKREDKPKRHYPPRLSRATARDKRELRLEAQFINVCRAMMPEKMFNDAMKMAKNRLKEAELQQVERHKRVQEAEANRAAREARINERHTPTTGRTIQ